MGSVEVYYEATPNPQTMKFVVTQPIAEESVNMTDVQQASRSPLAQKLFGFPWMAGVYVGSHFITITKQEWVDWETLAQPLSELIKEHIENNEPVLLPATESPLVFDENDSDEVKKIKSVIQHEIRPAVAMDGGDIIFHKFEDNVVYLYMQGSCAGCPSSTMTLKDGIEVRLKEVVPQIKEVVAL